LETPKEMEHFVGQLNRRLAEVSERFSKLPDLDRAFTPDEYVRLDKLQGYLLRFEEDAAALTTSEGDAQGGGAGSGRRSSRLRRLADEAAAEAVVNAIPVTKPPSIAEPGALGTTTDPPIFALSDHTHGGGPRTVMATPLRAGVSGVQDMGVPASDLAFRRKFLLMGG
jgi:hypothetical protein